LNVSPGLLDIPEDSILRPSTHHEEITMTYGTVTSNKLTLRACALVAAAIVASVSHAQVPQQGYPQAQAPMPQQQFAQTAPKAHPIRDLFAGTLAMVLQTATSGLAGAVNGRIMDWFARKGGAQTQGFQSQGYTPPAPTAAYPSQTYPSQQAGAYPAGPDPATANAYPPAANAYPPAASAYPPAATAYPPAASAYPPASGYPPAATDPNANNPYGAAPPPQVYDARTGQPVSGDANSPYATAPASNDSALYAGIAYEVHAIAADGSATPVNSATHEFRTGDKFMVYYRPSLPGRMEVYNINPTGQQTLIDASNMAAGQLTSLGPYVFTNLTGDESLRLVLSPCSNPQLLAATRDIVRADAAPPTGGGVQLSTCGAPTTRGLKRVRTRDIQKVAVDGGTSYALDPVSQQEQSSGQVGPREVTIVFRHR
jgi:hypothetical protein